MTRLKQLEQQLNDADREKRIDAVRELRALIDAGELDEVPRTSDTNNHVHTTYSFSAYSPSAAVWEAYKSGLVTVGIVDHDSVAGAREFIQAGDILGITTTAGAEIRLSFADTPFGDRTLNSPDEPGVAYVACHGVPHNRIEEFDRLLARIREARGRRNRAQVDRLNGILEGTGLILDYDTDVVPLSEAADGGSVTERHILYALAKKIVEKCGRGQGTIDFIENSLHIQVTGKALGQLLDTDYEHYLFDVLNILKSDLVPRFFIAGGSDSLPVKEVVPALLEMGIIPTYCYLGDVGESPTGDKKAQKFEDSYLDELLPVLKDLGFEAIAYMPSRNTDAQLSRVMGLCRQHGFMEISGEDINQPRQDFICVRIREPEYAHLADGTWALVGHEHMAGRDSTDGITGCVQKEKRPDISDRIAYFAEIGRRYRRGREA